MVFSHPLLSRSRPGREDQKLQELRSAFSSIKPYAKKCTLTTDVAASSAWRYLETFRRFKNAATGGRHVSLRSDPSAFQQQRVGRARPERSSLATTTLPLCSR